MRETAKSLKMYFIVVAVLQILGGLGIFIAETPLEYIDSALTLIIGIAALYMGIKLDHLLHNQPKVLMNYVYATIGIKIILSLVIGDWIILIIAVLLGWYLIHNIKRLSGNHSHI